MSEYILKNGKKLKTGITTGTCATACATAAFKMIMKKDHIKSISIKLPSGETKNIDIYKSELYENRAICVVKKYSGDDPDITDKILICVEVTLTGTADINIDGGIGVGRVTQKGLDQDVGKAAINSVPRRMISENIEAIMTEYNYKKGVNVIVSVPNGEEIARKTFNSQLGIINGISIIGTTGIVEPMSEKALVDSLKVEMKVIKEKGYKNIIAYPGNYAKKFINENNSIKKLNISVNKENHIKFSNFLGEVLEFALELEFEEILIVGHIGKMVKVAGGMMNTHSNNGDFRMEMIACYAALYGASSKIVSNILSSVTTEHALEILEQEKIQEKVIKKIQEKAIFYINKKVDNKIKSNLIIYSNTKGILS